MANKETLQKIALIGLFISGLAILLIQHIRGYPTVLTPVTYPAGSTWQLGEFGYHVYEKWGFLGASILLGIIIIAAGISWKFRAKLSWKWSFIIYGPIFGLIWYFTKKFPTFLVPFLLLGPLTRFKRKRIRAHALWKVLKKYGGVTILRAARKSQLPLIGNLIRNYKIGDPYLENELPFVFRDLRVDYMTLMNYQTRLHTYFAKSWSVTEAKLKAEIIQKYFGGKGQTYEAKRNSVDKYRFSGKGAKPVGWANNRELVLYFFELLNQRLQRDHLSPEKDNPENLESDFLKEHLKEPLITMDDNYDKFLTNIKRIGMIHRFKSLKMHTIDLVALYGVYKHYYLFANENALYELWEYDVDKSEGTIRDPTGQEKEYNNPVNWDAVPTKRNDAWEKEVKQKYTEKKNEIFEEIREKIEKKHRDELLKKTKFKMIAYIKLKSPAIIKRIEGKYFEKFSKEAESKQMEVAKKSAITECKKKNFTKPEEIKKYVAERIEQIMDNPAIIDMRKKDANSKLANAQVKEQIEKEAEKYMNKLIQGIQQSINPRVIERQLNDPKIKEQIERDIEQEFVNGRYVPKGVLISDEEEDEEKVATYESEIRRRIGNKYKLDFADKSRGLRHEVDVRGFVLEDIHRIEIDKADKASLPYIRRIKIEDMEDFPQERGSYANWVWVYGAMENEWLWFLEDLRNGTYHPHSKTFDNYDYLIKEENLLKFDEETMLSFEKSSARHAPGLGGNPAFDHEALQYPGLWVYWGKRNYWDETPPEPRNPYPTLSTYGLSRFLDLIVRTREKNAEIHNRFLKFFTYETGSTPDVFTNLPAETGKK